MSKADSVGIKFSLFLLIGTAYLFLASGSPWVEAELQLDVARNFVRHQTFSVAREDSDIAVESPAGRFYDPHGITNVLVMMPIARLESLLDKAHFKNARQFASFLGALTGVVVNALACLVFFLMLLLFGRPPRTCFHATLCLAFMTIVCPYSSTNYEGNLEMLFVLSSLYSLFSYLKEEKPALMVISGVFAGLAINTREFAFIFLFCALVFIALFSFKQKSGRPLALFLSGLFPLLILWGYFNWLRTGSFYLTTHAAAVLNGKWLTRGPTGNIVVGLKGLLLSKGGSIFIGDYKRFGTSFVVN